MKNIEKHLHIVFFLEETSKLDRYSDLRDQIFLLKSKIILSRGTITSFSLLINSFLINTRITFVTMHAVKFDIPISLLASTCCLSCNGPWQRLVSRIFLNCE